MKPEKLWRLLYLISLPLGAILLAHSWGRLTDGDDGWLYYEAGMQPWSAILRETFLPPDNPFFIFTGYRPFSTRLYPKLLWELGLSLGALKVWVWISGWAMTGIFGWAMARALGLGLTLSPAAPWVIATLAWWAAPSLILYSMVPGFPVLALSYLAIGMSTALADPKLKGQARRRRLAICAVLGFLGCYTHESTWFLYLWFALWLTFLRFRGVLSQRGLHPAWPAALVLLYWVMYRSFDPAKTSPGFNYSHEIPSLLGNAAYFALALLNGLAEPLVKWTGAARRTLDVTPMGHPLALLASVAGVALLTREARGALGSGREAVVRKVALGGLVFFAAMLCIPYLPISSHRFIYWARLPSLLIATALGVLACLDKKTVRTLPIALWLGGSILASHQVLTHWTWLDFNDQDARIFFNIMAQRPDVQACSSSAPCCVTFVNRGWNRNEWMLSWLSGQPKYPPLIPADWPTPPVPCARTLALAADR